MDKELTKYKNSFFSKSFSKFKATVDELTGSQMDEENSHRVVI